MASTARLSPVKFTLLSAGAERPQTVGDTWNEYLTSRCLASVDFVRRQRGEVGSDCYRDVEQADRQGEIDQWGALVELLFQIPVRHTRDVFLFRQRSDLQSKR